MLIRRKPRKELFGKSDTLKIDPDFKRHEPDYYSFRDFHKLESIHDAILESAHLIWNYQQDLISTSIPQQERLKPGLGKYIVPPSKKDQNPDYSDMVDLYLEKVKEYGFTSAATAALEEYTEFGLCVPQLNQRTYSGRSLLFEVDADKLYRRQSLP